VIDELEILRGWEAPPHDDDADAVRERARARLLAHIVADAAPEPRRHRPRWWLVAAPGALAAAAAVAIAIAVVISVGSGVQEGHVAPAPATAAEALERAAAAATRTPNPEPFPRPDQFFYTRTQATYMDITEAKRITIPSLDTRTREAWISHGRDGGERTIGTRQRFPSAAARQAWERAGRFTVDQGKGKDMVPLGKTKYYLGNEQLSYAQLLGFDQTGPELYRRLRAHYVKGQGGTIDNEVFTWVGDALREQASPPHLRAALYRVLKEIPGVRYLGRVRDRLGRPAIGVARMTIWGTRSELLFDPDTSAMLAERQVMVTVPKELAGLVPPGTVTTDAVYEQRGVVDRVGERP
jgi:hypothetical protein